MKFNRGTSRGGNRGNTFSTVSKTAKRLISWITTFGLILQISLGMGILDFNQQAETPKAKAATNTWNFNTPGDYNTNHSTVDGGYAQSLVSWTNSSSGLSNTATSVEYLIDVTGHSSGATDIIGLERDGGYYESSDNGANWFTVADTTNSDKYSGTEHYKALTNITSDDRAFRSGYVDNSGTATSVIEYSDDSGGTWTRASDEPAEEKAYRVSKDQAGGSTYYVGTGDANNGGGVYQSGDNGDRWSQMGSYISGTSDVLDVAAFRGDSGSGGTDIVYAATYSGLYYTTDGGSNWSQALSFQVDVSPSVKIELEVSSSDFVYVLGSTEPEQQTTTSVLYKSDTTRGTSFSSVSISGIGNPYDIEIEQYPTSNTHLIYAATADGVYRQVSDSGTWTLMEDSGESTLPSSDYQDVETVAKMNSGALIIGGVTSSTNPEISRGMFFDDTASDEPYVQSTANNAVEFSSLSGFSSNPTYALPLVNFQISHNGTDWYWWDSTADSGNGAWVTTSSRDRDEANDAGTIDSNIGDFVSDVGTGDFYFTAILKRNDTSGVSFPQSNEAIINNVDLTYENAGVNVTGNTGLTTTEAGGTDTFDVVLNSQPSSDVTIPVSSTATDEGQVTDISPNNNDTSTITFTSSNWDTTQTVTVTGQDDDIDDGDQSYNITLGTTSSADSDYNGLNPDDASLTNTDDDTAGITVSPTTGLTTTEGGGTATYTVVLDSQPTDTTTIPISSSDSSEGQVTDISNSSGTSTITFTTSNWDTTQTVTVTGQDDQTEDGNISYQINQGPASSNDSNYDGMSVDNVRLTNSDNDTAGITVSKNSITTTEAGGSEGFDVYLNTEPTDTVTIPISSSDSGEGQITSVSDADNNSTTSLLTFTTSNWDTAQTVTVTGQDDDIDDGDQSYTITLSPANSNDSNYNNLDPDDVSATNTDDDTAGVTASPDSGLTTSEGGQTDTFDVTLDSEPTATVNMSIGSDDTSEGQITGVSDADDNSTTSTLTFTTDNWNTAQTVTVTGQDDSDSDGDQSYTVTLDSPTSNDSNYSSLSSTTVSLTNTDDETGGGVGGGSGGDGDDETDTGNPQVASTSPADGDIGVNLYQQIVINFSEPMNTSTVDYEITSLGEPMDTSGFTEEWSDNNQTLTLAHSDDPFFNGSPHTLVVTGEDTDGNQLEDNETIFTTVLPKITFQQPNVPVEHLAQDTISDEIIIQLIDDITGNDYSVEEDGGIDVSLITSTDTGVFDTDPEGPFDGSVTSVHMNQGEGTASFYYQDSEPSEPNYISIAVAESPAKGWVDGLQNYLITTEETEAQEENIYFSDPPQSVTEGQFSEPMTIEFRDENGEPIEMDEGTDLYFNTTSNTGLFYQQEDGEMISLPFFTPANIQVQAVNPQILTLEEPTTSVTVFYKDTQTGTPTLTVADNYPAQPDTGAQNAMQTINVLPSADDDPSGEQPPEETDGTETPLIPAVDDIQVTPVNDGSGKEIDRVELEPATASMAPGETSEFKATAIATDGSKITETIYNWYVVNGGGEITKQGLPDDNSQARFTAGADTGRFNQTVMVATMYNGKLKAATSNVRVVDLDRFTQGDIPLPDTGANTNTLQLIFLGLAILSGVALAGVQTYEKQHFDA